MAEFRKRLTVSEIESGSIFWTEEQDREIKQVIPQTLVFDLINNGIEYANLSVEWEKRRLFVGEPIATAAHDSELVLVSIKDRPTALSCVILTPQEKMVIRKRLSHQEHSRRYLKWFAREDELYSRLLGSATEFLIEVAGKKIKGRAPDFEKRTLYVGDSIRFFSPGDDLIIHWNSAAETPTLVVVKEELVEKPSLDGTTSLRSLVARLLSRPLGDFNEGEVKGLILLLDENKKLWEKLSNFQEENRCLKEQVNMLESLFEQFASNSFFNSKKEFEQWVARHVNLFEKGLRVLHRNYSVTFGDGRRRRIDLLCQDRKGILVAAQILYNPEFDQVNETLELIEHLRANIEAFGSELTGGQLKAADIRGMIIADCEKTDLVERCLQHKVKLCLVKSGCLIDILE
jgi:hypothetical protein